MSSRMIKDYGTRWSQEDDKVIMTLHEKGYSGSVIAQRFGCSRNAVLGRIRRLKKKGK